MGAGFTAIEAAEDAISDFLAAEETTEAAIDLAVLNTVSIYDDALNDAAILGVGASDYVSDTQATRDALLASGQAIAAANLANAQATLATAEGALAAVAGLADAVTADASDAKDDADDAAAAALVEESAEMAALAVTAAANSDVTSIALAAGALTVTLDASAALIAEVTVDLAEVSGTTGLASLADPDVAWDATETAEFVALQGIAGVAETIALFNARFLLDGAADDAGDALDDADDLVDYLDQDTGASGTELGLIGAGFTITDVAVAATPTYAEVQAEVTALASAASAAQSIEDAAIVADDAADDALLVAQGNTTTATNEYGTAETAADIVTTDGAGGVPVTTNTLARAPDGSVQGNLGAGLVDIIVVEAGSLVFAVGIVNDAGNLLADLLATSSGQLAAEAAEQVADDVVNTAVTGTAAVLLAAQGVDNNADIAVTGFAGLITDWKAAEGGSNPLADDLVVPQDAVDDAEANVEAIADGQAGLGDAAAVLAALTALESDLGDAQDAFTDEGYSLPEDVDAAAEFATIADDIFRAGDLDSAIYNFNLQGSDTLYVGTGTVNTTEIGSGTGQTALSAAGNDDVLEIFLQEDGTDTIVIIEDQAFGSSATSSDDITEITLVGVSIDDVSIVNGFVTVA